MTISTLGVGIFGAGPVTQAIHLPTLALISDLFMRPGIMDLAAAVAKSVAGRVGAACRAGTRAVMCENPFAMSQSEAEESRPFPLRPAFRSLAERCAPFGPGWLQPRAAGAT